MKRFIAVSSLLFSGCASIVGQKLHTVTFDTDPSPASMTVKDAAGTVLYNGTSPYTMVVRASAGYFQKAEYVMSAKAEGRKASARTVLPSISGWYWGNIVFGGLIGWFIVDPLTGAMYTLEPRYVLPLPPE